jgi:hypothetical protein
MKAHLLGLQNVMELFFLNCNSWSKYCSGTWICMR